MPTLERFSWYFSVIKRREIDLKEVLGETGEVRLYFQPFLFVHLSEFSLYAASKYIFAQKLFCRLHIERAFLWYEL